MTAGVARPSRPRLPGKTRWDGNAALLNSVLYLRPYIISALWNPSINENSKLREKANALRKVLCGEPAVFWARAESLASIITPISDAIDAIQGDKVTAASAMSSVYAAFDQARNAASDFKGFSRDT